jgi:hypothetical protein
MRWDDKDPVWRLLDHAPLPEPDAWFAARTLARCRNEALAAESGGMVSLARVWRWALGGGVAICLALTLAVTQQVQHTHTEKVDNQKNVQEAFEIIASIDNSSSDSDSSSSSASPSTWQDSSL